jgi:hypothetical protein
MSDRQPALRRSLHEEICNHFSNKISNMGPSKTSARSRAVRRASVNSALVSLCLFHCGSC